MSEHRPEVAGDWRESNALGCERVDPVYEREHSRQSKTAWQGIRGDLNREEHARRERMPLGKRLSKVLNSIISMTTTPATSISSGSKDSEPTNSPPLAEIFGLGSLQRREVEAHVEAIRTHIAALELAHDQHLGFIRATTQEFGSSKDAKLIENFEGFAPMDIFGLEPSLGTPATIRKIRRLHKRDPETGRVIDDE